MVGVLIYKLEVGAKAPSESRHRGSVRAPPCAQRPASLQQMSGLLLIAADIPIERTDKLRV